MSDLWVLEITAAELGQLRSRHPRAYRVLETCGEEVMHPGTRRYDGWPDGKRRIRLSQGRVEEMEAIIAAEQ